MLAFTLAFSCTGVVAATNQATATEDLFGHVVVGRVADRGGQTGDPDEAKALEPRPNVLGGLGQ